MNPASHNPSLQSVPPGWHELPPEKMPGPSIWPVTLAFGATLLLWGLIASLFITTAGLLLFALSLAGWIRQILHEHREP